MKRVALWLLGSSITMIALSWIVAVPAWASAPMGAGTGQLDSPGFWIGLFLISVNLWPLLVRGLVEAAATFRAKPIGAAPFNWANTWLIAVLAMSGVALAAAAFRDGSLLALLLLIAIVLVLLTTVFWLRTNDRLPRAAPPLWVQGLYLGPWCSFLSLLLVAIWQDPVYDGVRAVAMIGVSIPLFGVLGALSAIVSTAWLKIEPDGSEGVHTPVIIERRV